MCSAPANHRPDARDTCAGVGHIVSVNNFVSCDSKGVLLV
jgi:hypothetical protein